MRFCPIRSYPLHHLSATSVCITVSGELAIFRASNTNCPPWTLVKGNFFVGFVLVRTDGVSVLRRVAIGSVSGEVNGRAFPALSDIIHSMFNVIGAWA